MLNSAEYCTGRKIIDEPDKGRRIMKEKAGKSWENLRKGDKSWKNLTKVAKIMEGSDKSRNNHGRI